MKLETLFLVCCACALEAKKKELRNEMENEVLDKGGVMVRFPTFLYEVPKEALNKNVVQRKFKGRTIATSVEPMQGTNFFYNNVLRNTRI